MLDIQHVAFFDSPLIVQHALTVKRINYHQLGSIYPTLKPSVVSNQLITFIMTHRHMPLVLITLGSFAKHYSKDNFLSKLLSYVTRTCAVIFMGSADLVTCRANNVYYQTEYLCYSDIISDCDFILFSGSLCLQNVAWAHGKRMGYVPHLREQYFWARNYENLTGVPYVDKQKAFEQQTCVIDKILNQPQYDTNIKFFNPSGQALINLLL